MYVNFLGHWWFEFIDKFKEFISWEKQDQQTRGLYIYHDSFWFENFC